MAQTGYTAIQLYRTTTGGAAPTAGNLAAGELAINIADADMALYAKNNSGTVKRLMNNPAGLKYPTADGTSGYAITTDGAGNLSFTAVGVGDMVLASTQTVTGAKTFNPTALLVKGSSTGATTFTTANSSATNYTITFPAASDTVAVLAAAQTLVAKTWTGESVTTVAKGNSGTSTQTYDYSAGTLQTSTATGNHTIAFSNWPTSGNLGVLQIILTNGGAYTLTWPTINWIKPDGTLTTSISTYLSSLTGRSALQTSGTDQFIFWTIDAGTTVYGKIV